MAGDIIGYVNEFDIESPEFADRFFYQVVARDLTEAAIINVSQNSGLQMIAGVNLDDRPLDKRFPAAVLTQLRGGETRVITEARDRRRDGAGQRVSVRGDLVGRGEIKKTKK